MMSLCRIIAAVLVVLALGAGDLAAQKKPPAGPAPAQEKTLYQRLGGYDTIAAIVDDIGSRLAGDSQMRRFFLGHSKDSLARQRQLVLDLICDLAGGPCIYIGRDLKTAHAGLGISPADWERTMSLLAETLSKVDVAQRERRDFMALIAGLQNDIVEK